MTKASFGETVTAAEISRNFGDWQSRAMHTPVTITHHGRPRLVMLSVDLFNQSSGADIFETQLHDAAHAHAQLRAVLSQIHDGFLALDTTMRVTDMNSAAELFIGLAKEEVVGRDLRDLLPQTRFSIAWDFYHRVVRTGEALEFRIKSTIRNGPPMKVQAFPYDDIGVGVIFTNLSSQEEAQVLRKRSDAMKAALQFEPAISQLRLNARGIIEEVDDHFCTLSGFAMQQLTGLMLTELANAKERPLLQRALNAAIRDEEPKTVSATIVTRSGQERRLRFGMCLATHSSIPEDLMVWAIQAAVADLNPASS